MMLMGVEWKWCHWCKHGRTSIGKCKGVSMAVDNVEISNIWDVSIIADPEQNLSL